MYTRPVFPSEQLAPKPSRSELAALAMANHKSRVVIEGTLRNEDLIPAFVREALELLDAEDQEDITFPLLSADEIEETHVFVSEVQDRMRNTPDYFNTEDADADLDELFTTLNSMAQDGEYFGANEGDGACFGWWDIVDNFFNYGD